MPNLELQFPVESNVAGRTKSEPWSTPGPSVVHGLRSTSPTAEVSIARSDDGPGFGWYERLWRLPSDCHDIVRTLRQIDADARPGGEGLSEEALEWFP